MNKKANPWGTSSVFSPQYMSEFIETALAAIYAMVLIVVFGGGYIYHCYWSYRTVFVNMAGDRLVDQVLVISGILVPPIGGINGFLRLLY